jgi:hypothetical protein
MVTRALASESREAGERTRTADPFITSEVLYQLSYAGDHPSVDVDPNCPAGFSRPASRMTLSTTEVHKVDLDAIWAPLGLGRFAGPYSGSASL